MINTSSLTSYYNIMYFLVSPTIVSSVFRVFMWAFLTSATKQIHVSVTDSLYDKGETLNYKY